MAPPDLASRESTNLISLDLFTTKSPEPVAAGKSGPKETSAAPVFACNSLDIVFPAPLVPSPSFRKTADYGLYALYACTEDLGLYKIYLDLEHPLCEAYKGTALSSIAISAAPRLCELLEGKDEQIVVADERNSLHVFRLPVSRALDLRAAPAVLSSTMISL